MKHNKGIDNLLHDAVKTACVSREIRERLSCKALIVGIEDSNRQLIDMSVKGILRAITGQEIV